MSAVTCTYLGNEVCVCSGCEVSLSAVNMYMPR